MGAAINETKKSKLWFVNSEGNKRQIGIVKNAAESRILISDFLKKHNYKSYYTRIWQDDTGHTWFDVGSWSEFFVLDPPEDDQC